MNMNKFSYKAPSAQVVALAQEQVICLSGNSGTESIGVSATSYSDSDFV